MSRFEFSSVDGRYVMAMGIDHALGAFCTVSDSQAEDENNEEVISVDNMGIDVNEVLLKSCVNVQVLEVEELRTIFNDYYKLNNSYPVLSAESVFDLVMAFRIRCSKKIVFEIFDQ